MPYSRPAYNAANESFQGSAAFTRPASTAANLQFVPLYQATGFMPVTFGTPASLIAAGFMPVRVGTPACPYTQTGTATGFMPVVVGVPSAPNNFQATGFMPVHVGTPQLVPTAVGFMPVRVGTPMLRMVASGFMPVTFGTPTYRQFSTAAGLRIGSVGTPTSPVARTFTATGFVATRFTTPIAIRTSGTTLNRRCLQYMSLRPARVGTPYT